MNLFKRQKKMISLILSVALIGDLRWSEVMLRDPIRKSAAVNPGPAPGPRPTPGPKPDPAPSTACFCTSCSPCKCRDGKHSPGCSEGKPSAEVLAPQKYRAYGGSGQLYEHENETFLNQWLQLNDPALVVRQPVQQQSQPCPPGTSCPQVQYRYVR